MKKEGILVIQLLRDFMMQDKFDMLEKKIPEFSLPNSRDETININQFFGKKNIIVILLRGIM